MKTMVVLIFALLLGLPPTAAFGSESIKLTRATELVDGYFGDHSALDQAASLIGEVLKVSPNSADAYVQAARITIKGGHVVSQTFRPGTLEQEEALLDRALSIDPRNVDALALKAELYLLQDKLALALSTAQLGLSIAPANPWLRITLGMYYERLRDAPKAIDEYEAVVARGRGNDRDQVRAYPRALAKLARLFGVKENAGLLRDLANKANQARNPKDAWTLGDFGQIFADVGLFDDSLDYCRRALAVMNYGVARRTLAFALYGKAAQTTAAGKDGTAFLREANAMNYSRQEIVTWFEDADPVVTALLPVVKRLLATTQPPELKPKPDSRAMKT